MAHSVGALLLPAPAPAAATDSLTDPALDILGDYFRAVLTAWLSTAWLARAPGETVVRTLEKHDPEELDFSVNKLPMLCLWRERETEAVKVADAYDESESELNILWVLPPAPQTKDSRRYPFFNGFASAIKLAVKLGRHPSYVHASEAADAGAIAYGSDVLKLAAIDRWRRGAILRTQVTVEGLNRPLMGYLATVLLTESTVMDPSVNGVEPTVIYGDITDGQDPAFVRQSFLIPPDADAEEEEPEEEEDP